MNRSTLALASFLTVSGGTPVSAQEGAQEKKKSVVTQRFVAEHCLAKSDASVNGTKPITFGDLDGITTEFNDQLGAIFDIDDGELKKAQGEILTKKESELSLFKSQVEGEIDTVVRSIGSLSTKVDASTVTSLNGSIKILEEIKEKIQKFASHSTNIKLPTTKEVRRSTVPSALPQAQSTVHIVCTLTADDVNALIENYEAPPRRVSVGRWGGDEIYPLPSDERRSGIGLLGRPIISDDFYSGEKKEKKSDLVVAMELYEHAQELIRENRASLTTMEVKYREQLTKLHKELTPNLPAQPAPEATPTDKGKKAAKKKVTLQ